MKGNRSITPRRRVALALGLIALMGFVVAPPTFAAPGDLDPSFGVSGVARNQVGEISLLDAAGRTIVVGAAATSASNARVTLARFLSDGSPDPSFTTSGSVEFPSGAPHAATLDAAGRIVVAGQAGGPGVNDVLLARFLPTGAPDTSFGGGDGLVITDFTGPSGFDSARAVTADDSGRIVVAGGAPNILLARYTATGDLDTSFGGDGFVAETVNELFGIFGGFHDVVIDGSGRIVAVGGRFVAMRFLPSGERDTSFGGGDGMVGHHLEDGDEARAVAIDSANNVLVGGRTGFFLSDVPANYNFGVVRYSDAGVLDTSFGDGDSMAVADVSPFDTTDDLALDANGRIVLSGAVYDGSNSDLAMVRFLPSGRISGSFGGGDGVVTTDLGGDESGGDVAVDMSGRIILSGTTEDEGLWDFIVLRYEGGPTVDTMHSLAVATDGEGSVTGIGIDCGTECTAAYDEGTIVTLTAVPAHDPLGEVESEFTGWSGDCTGIATCQLTLDEPKDVTAHFAPLTHEPPTEEPPIEEPPEEPSEVDPPSEKPVDQPPAVLAVTQPPAATPLGRPPSRTPKPKKCKKGFQRKKVRGKVKCVKTPKGRKGATRSVLRAALGADARAAAQSSAKLATVYPVTLTTKVRSTPYTGCPNCQTFWGRVTSPNRACVRDRSLTAVLHYGPQGEHANKTYKQKSFATTESDGRWKIVVGIFSPIVRVETVVERLRLPSGAICVVDSVTVFPKYPHENGASNAPTVATASASGLLGSGVNVDVDLSAAPIGKPSGGKSPLALSGSVKGTELDGHGLRAVQLTLDRRLTVTTKGLGTCTVAEVTGKYPAQARKLCGDALIGSGSQALTLQYPDSPPAYLHGSMLIFNAGRETKPKIVAYVVYESENAAEGKQTQPFEFAAGSFGGTLTEITFRIGKTWTYKGTRYSYLSGSCAGALSTKATVALLPGTITLSGSVPTRCGEPDG